MKKMASNIGPLSFFFMVMFFSSYLHVAICETSLDQLLPGLGQSSFLQDAQCMQKLAPCQTYLKSQTNPPPETCCAPLKELHDNKSQCLCNIINRPSMLQSIGVSKDDLMKLPQACTIDDDFSSCGSQDVESSPAAEGEGSVPDEDIAETTSSTKTITPYGITSLGVPGFVALLSALVFSSY